MNFATRSRLWVGLVLTAFHVVMLSVPPVYIRLDQNKDDEFCFLEDGQPIPDDGIGGCVLDSAVLVKQYTMWLGLHAAILFSLFAVIAVVAFFALRRHVEGNWPFSPGHDRGWWVSWPTLRTCLFLTASYALAPAVVGPIVQAGLCVIGDSSAYTCGIGSAAFGLLAWTIANLVAISLSSMLFFSLLFVAGGIRHLARLVRARG